MAATKSALITGCSNGGIGSALAQELHRRGYIIFATVRTPSKASDLAALPNTTILTLDVTDKESIAAAALTVAEKTGGRGLDVLVNNAGSGLLGPITEIDLEAARKLFDVNFWGVLAVTQAFTSLLVQAQGLIVNISSSASIMHTPWMSMYNCSKAALSMASANMRVELKPLGVRVQCVVAGVVASQFDSNVVEVELRPDSFYKGALETIQSLRTGALRKNDMPVNVFVKKVAGDIMSGKSGETFRGGMASTAAWCKWLLPRWLLVSIQISLRV
jgi:1-acylglycerone phosphate reductase